MQKLQGCPPKGVVGTRRGGDSVGKGRARDLRCVLRGHWQRSRVGFRPESAVPGSRAGCSWTGWEAATGPSRPTPAQNCQGPFSRGEDQLRVPVGYHLGTHTCLGWGRGGHVAKPLWGWAPPPTRKAHTLQCCPLPSGWPSASAPTVATFTHSLDGTQHTRGAAVEGTPRPTQESGGGRAPSPPGQRGAEAPAVQWSWAPSWPCAAALTLLTLGRGPQKLARN